MSQPIRVQRRRVKGYRHPENTKFVGRPTKWGNPFVVAWEGVKKEMWMDNWCESIDHCLESYDMWLEFMINDDPEFLEPLRDKNLSCFCKLSDRCHVDIIFSKLYKTSVCGIEQKRYL